MYTNSLSNIKKSTLETRLSRCGFIEVKMDKDGLYSGLVLPPPHALLLWRLSWISCLSGIYAIARGHYLLAPVPLGVWLTSMNYWKYPVQNSMRRKIDIGYVLLSLTYQLLRSLNAQYAIYYWIIMSVTVAFFPLGHLLNNHNAWLGTFCQGMVHIGGNVGNIILYSGYISLNETAQLTP
jgi:hypothetical protein